jgi:alpha-galactosidase
MKELAVQEGKTVEDWVARAMQGAPPCSFLLDGVPSANLMKGWDRTHERRVGEDGVVVHSVVFREAVTGMVCRLDMLAYTDSPAVEWVVRFRNGGSADTPILSDVNALEIVLDSSEKAQPLLFYSKGTAAKIDDFALQEQPLLAGQRIELASRGSRVVLPFFNLDLGESGVIGAIGWTGNWKCVVQRSEKGPSVELRAGMAKTHLRLRPGEEIRTPRMLVLFWEGDRLRAHNLLRRHLVVHHLPKLDGRTVEPPLCDSTWGGMKTATHLKTLTFVEENRLAFDCYWIDAGWYGPDHETEEFQNFHTEDWAYHIGHWRVNRVVHPDGLRPIADRAHALGMKLLLWFSPYTAEVSSPLVKEHPEWIVQQNVWGAHGIGMNKTPVNLCSIDIGNPEARQFLVDYISGLIAEHGVDHFRDDGGLPLPPPGRDASDRQGIGEIRAVEGFYAFWDELLRRHPGMLIDNCGGGGSRIDLETISRSLVLHRTDYNCYPKADPMGFQVGTHGLSHWVPLVGGCTPARPGDTYNFRSAWCGGLPFGLFHPCGYGEAATEPAKDYPVAWHRKMLAGYRRVRPFLTGDFYPLTPGTLSQHDWYAWQMDRPDLGEGVVVAYRRKDSPFLAAAFPLQGLEPQAVYTVENLDTGTATRATGQALLETGLTVAINDKPGTSVHIYRKARQRDKR